MSLTSAAGSDPDLKVDFNATHFELCIFVKTSVWCISVAGAQSAAPTMGGKQTLSLLPITAYIYQRGRQHPNLHREKHFSHAQVSAVF